MSSSQVWPHKLVGACENHILFFQWTFYHIGPNNMQFMIHNTWNCLSSLIVFYLMCIMMLCNVVCEGGVDREKASAVFPPKYVGLRVEAGEGSLTPWMSRRWLSTYVDGGITNRKSWNVYGRDELLREETWATVRVLVPNRRKPFLESQHRRHQSIIS